MFEEFLWYKLASFLSCCSDLSDLDKIRQSCELFASVYPLAPEIWLRWLRIELNIATTESEYEKVHQLFRRSLSDYYCKKKISSIGAPL